MVQRQIAVAQLCRDAAVAVSSSVFMVNCCDLFLGCSVLIFAAHPFQIIIEGCTGQLSEGKKNIQRKVLPQLLNYQRFFVSASLVLQNQGLQVFRYAFSARSRCTSARRSSSACFGRVFGGRPLLPRLRRSIAKPSGPSV